MATNFPMLLTLLSVFGIREVVWACPANATQRLQACMGSITQAASAQSANRNASGLLPIEQIKLICQDSGRQAVGCMRALFDDCPDAPGFDAKYLDRIEDAIDMMCKNIDVIVEQGQCIVEQTENLKICAQNKASMYSQSETDDEDALCKSMKLVLDCTKEVIGYRCSEEAASVLEGAFRLTLPEQCSYILSSVTRSTVSLIALLMCVIAAFLAK